jgi:hypothetical protein
VEGGSKIKVSFNISSQLLNDVVESRILKNRIDNSIISRIGPAESSKVIVIGRTHNGFAKGKSGPFRLEPGIPQVTILPIEETPGLHPFSKSPGRLENAVRGRRELVTKILCERVGQEIFTSL